MAEQVSNEFDIIMTMHTYGYYVNDIQFNLSLLY